MQGTNENTSSSSSPITLQQFLKISPDDIDISVTKINSNIFMKTTYEVTLSISSESTNLYIDCAVQKRYTEFQGFYDSLTYRYQNLNFPQFPSKFQIIKKEESRKKFFDSLLRTVLKLASAHPEIKKELLKLLYEFVIEKNHGLEIKKLSDEKRKTSISMSLDAEAPLNQFTGGSVDRLSVGSGGKNYDEVSLRTSNTNEKIKPSTPTPINDSNLIANMFKMDQGEENTNKDGWQIEFKFLKTKFSKCYAKISEQCLFLYDSIVANNFFFCFPLCKVNYDIYKISETKKNLIEQCEINEVLDYLNNNNVKDFELKELKSEIEIHLYHSYDNADLIIKLETKTNDFNSLVKLLTIIEVNSNAVKSQSKLIAPIDETNAYIYGKLFLEIGQIIIPNFEGNIFANISLPPYNFKTKSLINSKTFSIRQMFCIPIHNRFEIMKIEIFSKSHQGLFQKRVVDEKLCEHSILMPDVLNDFFFPNKMMEVEMDNTNKNVKNAQKVTVTFKLRNYSSILALVTKNRNKNVLEDMTIAKSEEDISIKNLMKRMKKIILLVKDFKEYYKTVFRFKYPVYSSIMCLILLLYFLFCDTTYFISHILVFIAYVIFVHSQFFKTHFYPYAEKYIFSYKNPYDFESIVVTKVEMEDSEVKKENYLREQKEKKNLIKTIIEPIKNFKNYKNTYMQVLFKFTNFVSILEKFKNLFLWTDPLLSFYFLIMIICLLTLIYAIPFKYLMLFSILKKFISGASFYKRKHRNNLEIADIVLRHCHKEWCNETRNKIKKEQSVEKKGTESSTNVGVSTNANANLNSTPNKTNSQNTQEEVKNIDNITIFDDKFKNLIKEQLEKHADILIKMEFLNSVNKLGEIREVISKSKTLLKIKKESPLHLHTRDNAKIYKSPIDIELFLLYFVQNIKSDYYLSKYYHHDENGVLSPERQKGKSGLDIGKPQASNFSSVSNDDISVQFK